MMPTESKTPEIIESADLPLCAFAIARYSATLLSHFISQGKVRFRLAMSPENGTAFSEIRASYEKHGVVSGLLYSEALHKLKRIVIDSLRSQGVLL